MTKLIFHKFIFQVTLVSIFISNLQLGNGQTPPNDHQIRLQRVVYPTTPTISSSSTDPKTFRDTELSFSNAAVKQFCAYGMWALYNTINYGELKERSTSVMTIRGSAFNPKFTCVPFANYPDLKNTKSVRFLGNPVVNMPGLLIMSEPNWIGLEFKENNPGTTPTPTTTTTTTTTATIMSPTVPTVPTPPAALEPASIPVDPRILLGSIAITGTTGIWKICEDVACKINLVCIDMTKQRSGLFLNKNVPIDKSIGWPVYVRAYQFSATGTCGDDDGTVPSTRTLSTRSSGPGGKPGIEVL